MASGAIPLVALTVSAMVQKGFIETRGFYIRKSANDHGTARQIEYRHPITNHRVLIVEDVVTTGGSSLDAVRVLRDAGAIVEDVLTVVDREQGGVEAFAQEGVKLTSLLTAASLRELAF